MPTYDYECNTCDKVFEVFQGINDPKLSECPTCNSPVKRLLGIGSGVIFKGSGFYETDFKNKSGKTTASKNDTNSSQKSGVDSSAAKETKKSDKKDAVKE